MKDEVADNKRIRLSPSWLLSLGRVVAGVLSAGILTFVARSFSKPDFADFVLIMSLGTLTAVIHDGGRAMILTRETARHPEQSVFFFQRTLIQRLMLGLGAQIFVFLMSQTVLELDMTLILASVPSVLATIIYTTVFASLRAVNSVKLEAINEVSSRLFLLFVVISAAQVISNFQIIHLLLLYSFCDVVSAIIVTYQHRLLFSSFQINPRSSSAKLSPIKDGSFSIFIYSSLGALVTRLDVFVISFIVSKDALAEFALASRFIDFALVPCGAFVAMSIPNFARSKRPGVILEALRTMSVYFVVAFVGVQIFAGLIPNLFGPGYSESVNLLRILGMGLVFFIANNFFSAWLSVRYAGVGSLALLSSSVSSVIAHSFFTSTYGVVGAVVIMVMTQFFLALLNILAIRYSSNRNPFI